MSKGSESKDTIYQETVKNDEWVGSKEDVTYIAIRSVFERFMHKFRRECKEDGTYQINFHGIPYVLEVRKKSDQPESE